VTSIVQNSCTPSRHSIDNKRDREILTVLYSNAYGPTDFDRLTRVILSESSRVHERFDEHDERFNEIEGKLGEHDGRFNHIYEDLRHIGAELKQLRTELDDLTEKVGNMTGYRKEINHALTRIAATEKHLGIC
jgi:chromosome segregation ATPase